MNLCVYTCFVYLQPFCSTLDFKLFIDSIHILFLLYLLLRFWDFNIKNLQDFIKVYRALIKDIFLTSADPDLLFLIPAMGIDPSGGMGIYPWIIVLRSKPFYSTQPYSICQLNRIE